MTLNNCETQQKHIFLIIGRSGVGKSSVVDALCERYGHTAVQSYTTRPPRNPEEKGHIFITKCAFDDMKSELCAYTKYDNFEYGVTNQQIEDSDLYIIDTAGVTYFSEHYAGSKIPVVIFLYADREALTERLKARGHTDEEIKARIMQDDESFSPEAISKLPIPYNIFLNYDLDETVDRIERFITLHGGKEE